MEHILFKALEGGWRSDLEITTIREHKGTHLISFLHDENGQVIPDISPQEIVCDPLFWEALSKVSGWDEGTFHSEASSQDYEKWAYNEVHLVIALRFHEINLTKSWDKAVAYLLTQVPTRGTALVN